MKKTGWLIILCILLTAAACSAEEAAAPAAEAEQSAQQAEQNTADTQASAETGTQKKTTSSSIRSGSTGEAVRTLQQNLQKLGYYKGSITGNAGSLTVAAIRRFQRANGLSADGVAGPKTLAAIQSRLNGTAAEKTENGTTEAKTTKETTAETKSDTAAEVKPAGVIKSGSQGENVRKLQQDLQTLGYYGGSLTGRAGSLTVNAIRRFQRENGLGVDGKAGAKTLAAIQAKLNEKNQTGTDETAGEKTAAESGTETTSQQVRRNSAPALDTTKTLKRYSMGNDVTRLQRALKELGYFAGYETGFYGDYTEERIRLFQSDHRIPVTGTADTVTLSAINRDLSAQ